MESEKFTENNRLNSLLNRWSESRLSTDYELVMHELMEGNSWLLLPSINEEPIKHGRYITTGSTHLKLTCIYEVDGTKSIGVFSDEDFLFRWAKKPQMYTAVKSQDVLKICEANGIYNMVINSGSPNIFVAQRFKG